MQDKWAFVLQFPWIACAWSLVFYCVGALGVTAGLHRALSHGSTFWAERGPRFSLLVLLWFALPAGPPLLWAANHRLHHQFEDQERDPHQRSRGFWWAHTGWYRDWNRPGRCLLYALGGPVRWIWDALDSPFFHKAQGGLRIERGLWQSAGSVLRFWTSPWGYALSSLGLFCCCYLAFVGMAIWQWGLNGWTPMVALLWLWGLIAIMYNLGDAVNSVAHAKVPSSASKAEFQAQDLLILAIFTLGEGWHGQHHRFPKQMRCRDRWDPAGWVAQRISRSGS